MLRTVAVNHLKLTFKRGPSPLFQRAPAGVSDGKHPLGLVQKTVLLKT